MKALFKLRGMKLLNSVEMVAAGLMGITLFFLFLCYPHGNNILKNRWFWEKIFVVLSWMIGLQITVLTFVLSIYLPAIIKDINKLTIGIKESVRNRLLRSNAISEKIFQMCISVIINLFLLLVLFLLSSYLEYKFIVVLLIMMYTVISLSVWIQELWSMTFSEHTDYVTDCLLLLPTDEKNQNSYFTVIKRQLDNHLSSNDTFSLNRDLIQVAMSIDKYTQFTYFDQKCILSFLQIYEINQYINFLLETYENNVLRYSYLGNMITNASFNVPADNIDKFQNYMFTNNSNILQQFLIEIVKNHEIVKSEAQNLLIDYYCWCLDSLCTHGSDYSFIFSLDITQLYKDTNFARYFLISAMKITLSRESNNSARGLYRGYLLFLAKNGIDQYIQLKENDGSTAWLFCDLIYLTLTHDILNLSTFDSSDAWFEAGDYVYQITVKCAKNKSIFSEWMAYIYFRNLVTPRLKIEQNRFQMIFSMETLERHLSREQIKFLYEILNGDSTELIKLDALTWQFTRALEDDHDFNNNDKIKTAGYIRKISEILNRSNNNED